MRLPHVDDIVQNMNRTSTNNVESAECQGVSSDAAMDSTASAPAIAEQTPGCPPPPPYMAEDPSAQAGATQTPGENLAEDPSKYVYAPLAPPSYVVATELPTYDQVQQLKIEEEQHRQETGHFDPEALDHGEALLGTDFMFLCSFFVAFLFNWIGFVMLMCSCPTIAGRYGALSGFGLSLAKWTLIAKHSMDLFNTENSWLWWLIMAFGMLICVRAILQYITIKREWQILNRAAQERHGTLH